MRSLSKDACFLALRSFDLAVLRQRITDQLCWLLAHPAAFRDIQTGISLGLAHTSIHRVSLKDHFDEKALFTGSYIQLDLIS